MQVECIMRFPRRLGEKLEGYLTWCGIFRKTQLSNKTTNLGDTMPKKEWTDAERAEFGAKMKAARKKKEELPSTEVEAIPTPSQPDTNDVALLLQRIEELEKRQFFNQAPQQQQILSRSVTKFSINPRDYPDPTDRLFEEPRLKMKNFTPTWWRLEWEVSKTDYDKDSVHYTEPRFHLSLWHILEDDAGEPSNKSYKVCSAIFFEDPDSFIQVANQKGIDIPEILEADFMNEMRYMVVRDWLIECFYPPKPSKSINRTEMTINNRIVEVVELNSPDAVNAFAKLQSKA